MKALSIEHTILRIRIIRAINESAGRLFRATTQHRQNNSDNQSKKEGKDLATDHFILIETYVGSFYTEGILCRLIFSSPEPLAHGELLLSLDVHHVSSRIASKDISPKLLTGF